MSPRPNFDRIARLYRWAEYLTLGPLLQRTRTHFLPQLSGCKKALVLGDGDGRFLTKLLHQNARLHATAVDTSAAMLHLLRQRCAQTHFRLVTQQADALTVTPPPGTDLIVTHFFLDCLTPAEVTYLTKNIAAHVSPGTLWLLSDFLVPSGPLRPFARFYIRGLYLAFRLLTDLRVTRLPDPQSALRLAGFTCLARHQILAGILYTELWQRTGDTIVSNATMTGPPLRDAQRPAPHHPADALPDPEPAVPSLAEPDPAVFQHDPGVPEIPSQS